MSRQVALQVYGTPAPQGSKKFVGMHGGRGVMVESSKKVKPWRQDVKAAARELLDKSGGPAFDSAVVVRMVFTVAKPKSAPKRTRTWPRTKPDLSKLARSTEDALVDAGLLRDDSLIVDYGRLAKVYPGEDPEALESPGVRIQITALAA